MSLFIILLLNSLKVDAIYINRDSAIEGVESGALETGDSSGDGTILDVVFVLGFTFLTMIIVVILSMAVYSIIKRKLGSSEDDLLREEENQAYLELNSDEQELYFQSKEYLAANPYLRGNLTLSQNLMIQEKGISAFEFQKDLMLTNSDLLIINKYELNFFKQFECSTQTSLPIPMKNEVYYFESKIYSFPDPENTVISIGLGLKPYPWFRLPGRHIQSLSYDSDGYRRYNQPFPFETEPPFPKFHEGDVIGIGYRVRSGTVFFTRNGKKVSESKIGGHIKNFKFPQNGQVYPIIGANNLCSVHVNLGQMGYVFIEGNVKKWGFAAIEGTGPAPPAYNKFNADILLERSEIDESEISERESTFPPDFWEINGNGSDSEILEHDKYSYNAYSEVNSDDERITLNTLLPSNKPPSYISESESEDESESDGDDRPKAGPVTLTGSTVGIESTASPENGVEESSSSPAANNSEYTGTEDSGYRHSGYRHSGDEAIFADLGNSESAEDKKTASSSSVELDESSSNAS